jgi:DNA-binding response OmpR family regulator
MVPRCGSAECGVESGVREACPRSARPGAGWATAPGTRGGICAHIGRDRAGTPAPSRLPSERYQDILERSRTAVAASRAAAETVQRVTREWEAARASWNRGQERFTEGLELIRHQGRTLSALRSLLVTGRGTPAPEPDGMDRSSVLHGELVVGPLTLLPQRTAVRGGRRQVTLTPTEWQLMVALVRHRSTVSSRSELARSAWGPGFAGRDSEVEVYVSRLRRKLAQAGTPVVIETIRHQGYRLRLGTAEDGHVPEPPAASVEMEDDHAALAALGQNGACSTCSVMHPRTARRPDSGSLAGAPGVRSSRTAP